nr:O-methyltransferase [Lutimaribacter saemankumensis]
MAQIVAQNGRDGWMYASMAGEHLIDIQAIYRRSGIKAFYTFDGDERVVERQKFNQPLPNIQFGHHMSTELADRLDAVVEKAEAQRLIVWLDFTGTGSRKDQLDDFVAVLRKLAPGDVCRITMDAGHYFFKQLRDHLVPEGMEEEPVHIKVAAAFREALAPYSNPKTTALDKAEIANELVQCIGRACPMANARVDGNVQFVPLLLTRYGDESTMITVTVRCEKEDQPLNIPASWDWAPADWSDVLMINADLLSPRERATADARIDDPDVVCTELPFVDEDTIRAYARFHRYQPNFQNVAE